MTTRYTEARNAIDAPGAVGSPVERLVRPRAWAIFVDNGNARMWSTLQPHVQKLADAEGLTVTPLYDQAALDAVVAAERERWQARVEQAFREGYWARETYNDSEVSDADEKWASAKAGLLRA